jgi:hypothetical protein
METPLNGHHTHVCVKADPEIKPIKVAVESQSQDVISASLAESPKIIFQDMLH